MDNRNLVTRLSAKLGKSKVDVSNLLEGFTAVVTSCVSEMDAVVIPSFGAFETIKTDEHIAVNPSTGKRTLYPPKLEISFRASNILKKKLK